MSFLDELAFGPGRNWRAWVRALLLIVALVALAAVVLYFTVAGDYAYLKAAVYTGAPGGEYHTVGERLSERAQKKNGHLNVVATAGTVENIARLVGENGHCAPAFAFVQDGVPVPANAGLETLGRLPQPESLLLFARRGRAIASFADFRGASVGIGPEGSGTAYLVQHLLDNSDLKELGLKPANYGLEAQAALVQANQLDLAAFVMNENAALIRNLVQKYDLEIVAPPGIDGLTERDRWLHVGRIPAGYYDVARQIPATDKDVAQVDTLLATNACVGRAERVAFLKLLSDEFPSFVRSNPPPAAGRRMRRRWRTKRANSSPTASRRWRTAIFPSREPDVARLLDLSGDGRHGSSERLRHFQPLPPLAPRRHARESGIATERADKSAFDPRAGQGAA